MRIPYRLSALLSPLLLAQCAHDAATDSEKPAVESPLAADTDPGGLPAVSGRDGPMTIRDPNGKPRITGTVKGGRMHGVWIFRDSHGEKMAEVSYRGDLLHGPAVLRYVTADGAAAGRMRMQGSYEMGSLQGKAKNWWPGGGEKFIREFDNGILESVKGTREDGVPMQDGEAMSLALTESRDEETLLQELQNFVQLQIRKAAMKRPEPPAP